MITASLKLFEKLLGNTEIKFVFLVLHVLFHYGEV